MKNKKLMLLLAVLPYIIVIISLSFLPNQVPMHYNFAGELTRYGSKYESLIMPIFSIIIYLYFKYQIKNKYQDKNPNAKIENLVLMGNIVLLFFLVINVAFIVDMLLQSKSSLQIDITKIIFIIMGLFFIITGNFLPKIKTNNIIGNVNKKTIEDRNLWYKSQRFSGKILIMTGIIIIMVNLFVQSNLVCTIISLALTVIMGIVSYAYACFTK